MLATERVPLMVALLFEMVGGRILGHTALRTPRPAFPRPCCPCGVLSTGRTYNQSAALGMDGINLLVVMHMSGSSKARGAYFFD